MLFHLLFLSSLSEIWGLEDTKGIEDTWTQFAAGSVICFCNLPACISTGYMCKSGVGVCFSDLNQHPSTRFVYGGRHGCLELLTDKDQKDRCQRNPNENQHQFRRKSNHPRSLLHCCYNDMCNHVDDPQTKDLINDTALGEIFTADSRGVESQIDGSYSSADVWFKAATIAVPICGAVILFVLIALAIRLLKTESLYNTDQKLGGYNYPSSQDKNNTEKFDPYHTSDHLLYKDPLYMGHVDNVKRQIIITKDPKHNYEYNLLPQHHPQIFEIHKCYENKGNFTETCKNVDLKCSESKE